MIGVHLNKIINLFTYKIRLPSLVMNKAKTHTQKRAISAHLSSAKKQSPAIIKIQSRKVGKLLTQSFDNDYPLRGIKNRLYTATAQNNYRTAQKQSKEAQQLIQENHHLKNELNYLNNKLHLTRSKIQSQNKKTLIYAKKFNRQFQKQLYWPNQKQNDYLITGVKHQYEKLKKQYGQKCQQMQIVKRNVSATHLQEVIAYCDALETQNKILVQNISFLKNKQKKSSNQKYQEFSTPNLKYQTESLESLLLQQSQKVQRCRSKIKKLEQKLFNQTQTDKQLQKKIIFLQKLIVQKQNNSHHTHKEFKKVQKIKLKLVNQLKAMQQKVIKRQKQFQNDVDELKATNEKRANIQKQMFQRLLRQKNVWMQKLQKQIGYLSTLLSYWKPLDQLQKVDKSDKSSFEKQKTISLKNNSASLNQIQKRQLQSRPKAPANQLFMENRSFQQNLRYSGKSFNNQQSLVNKDLALLTINSQDDQRFQLISTRQPRRSTKKWSEEAKKCRKVNLSQIKHLGDLIGYKMIAYKKQLEQVKQYFSYKNLRHTSTKFEEQFMSMKEIKQLFISKPFQLSPDEASLLSRYIVQDEGAQHVYCHEGNEMQRSIVKSIIKAVIGQYRVPETYKSEQRWRQIKKVYSHNLQLALKSICPKGLITKDKLLQLINSLGIQMQDQVKNYLIGKLVQNQTSLNQLKYAMLFTNQQKIQ